MTRWLPALIGAILCGSAWGATSPNEYAYGRQLLTPGEGALYQLPLPEAVYEDAVYSDLRDVRVFNADGESVPFELQRPAQRAEQVRTRRDLDFFPLRASEEDNIPSNVEVRLKDRRSDTRVTVERDGGTSNTPVTAYLIAPETGEAASLDALILDWRGGGDSVARTTIQASDDLQNWRTLATGVPLARLGYEGKTLDVQRVDLDGTRARYLKLAWPEALGEARLEKVTGRFSVPGEAVPKQWRQADQERTQDGRALQIDAGGVFPVTAVRLSGTPANTVANLVAESRATPDAPWRARGQGRYHDIVVDDTRLERHEIELDQPANDRYWRIRVDPAAALTADTRAALGWRPHQLRFIAQGGGPFVLAWGNHAAATNPGMADLVRSVNTETVEPRPAELGATVELGGAQRLELNEPLPWREIVLWSVLLLVVAVVLFMARRLLHEMGRDRSN